MKEIFHKPYTRATGYLNAKIVRLIDSDKKKGFDKVMFCHLLYLHPFYCQFKPFFHNGTDLLQFYNKNNFLDNFSITNCSQFVKIHTLQQIFF